MPTLQTLSCSLHYRDQGRGEPAMVLLHGWCDDATVWDEVLVDLAATNRCLAPEMRGHGASGMPIDHAFFPEALGNDVLAICEAAAVERPVLVGHSYGGYLAAEIVRRYPDFARGVVVVDQALNLDAFGTQLKPAEAFIRSPETHLAFREQLKRSLMPEGTPASVIERVMTTGADTPVEVALGLWAPLFEYTETELEERGEALIAALGTLPALVITPGEQPNYAAMVRGLAPSATVEVMAGNHWLQLEHPGRLGARLRQFVGSLRG